MAPKPAFDVTCATMTRPACTSGVQGGVAFIPAVHHLVKRKRAVAAVSPQSPSNSSISTDARRAGKNPAAAFGPNEWLVDEIYQQYLQDPNSVDRAWWDFFADYKPGGRRAPRPAGPARRGGPRAPPRRRGPPRRRPPPGRARARPPAAATPAAAPAGRPGARPGAPAAARRRPPRRPRPPAAARPPRRPRPPAAASGARRAERPRVRDAARPVRRRREEHERLAGAADGHVRARRPGEAAVRQPHRHQQPPQARPRRQGLLHAPHRLRDGAGAQGHAVDEPLLRGEGRQADPGQARRTSTSASPSTW